MGKYVKKIFAGSSNPVLAKKIAHECGMSIGNLSIKRFSDGELWVKYEENLRGNDIYLVQSTNPPADNVLELALLIDAAKRASAQRINVIMPYFGYSRQDRKDEPRVPISAKVMMDIFIKAGADRIVTMDLHSTQIQGFSSKPVDNIYGSLVLMPELEKHFNELSGNDNLTVLVPDMGSSKLGQSYAKRLGMSFALIDKRRSSHNQSEVVSVVGELENQHILIIDDMIDTAGTISNAASVAKQKGALTVTVAATHGILSGDAIKKLSDDTIDSIFLTDTIDINIKNLSKLKIISSAKIFAETINRIHNGESVSQLFRKVT
ncbi:MAG: ribose-phosphate diphosphokinase [Candidatus Neomarinimicrobiota bacterium]